MLYKTIKHPLPKGATEYILYTKKEADEQGIEYVYWHEAINNCYVLSDDDMVAKVFFCRWYDRKGVTAVNKLVKTAFGMAFFNRIGSTGKLRLSGNAVNYTVTGKRVLCGKRKEKLRMIAVNYAISNDLDYSINKIAKTYPGMQVYNWKNWTKTEVFKAMVREEVTKLLVDKGFSEAQTIDLLDDTIKLAKGKSDTKSLVGIVQILLKMHGIDQPAKTKVTNQLDAEMIDQIYDETGEQPKEIKYHGTITEQTEEYDE